MHKKKQRSSCCYFPPLITKLSFFLFNLRKMSKNGPQVESQLSQLWFPHRLLGKSSLPHCECSLNQLHQGPWDLRGSFVMML